MPEIVIVGGGLAGMAASVALATAGRPVLLLESRPRLGGRASSFPDHTTGSTIDNCQHVNLRCCTNFQHFCHVTEIADALRTEHKLVFIGADHRMNTLRAWPLPAPLHLLPSFASLSYLSWHDKWRLAWGLKALAHRSQAHSQEIMSQWLIRHHQPAATVQRVWHTVLVSALSETLDRITVGVARKVFVDAFLANRQGWEMQVPDQPLDTLYTQRVGTWLTAHQVDVQLQTGVQSLCFQDNRVTGVFLRDGTLVSAQHVVLAVPAYLISSFLPPGLKDRPEIQSLNQLEWAPISSVHLWFDRKIMPLAHATLVDRLAQWIFYRGCIQTEGEPPREYYQVVISASREVARLSQEETISQVVQELLQIWPAAAAARLVAGRVVTEHRACISMLPNTDKQRPTSQSPWKNLYFAGDWTSTGWPSTMEGAVRSGYLAAEAILQAMGQQAPCLQPDLPVSWLSKTLLGL